MASQKNFPKTLIVSKLVLQNLHHFFSRFFWYRRLKQFQHAQIDKDTELSVTDGRTLNLEKLRFEINYKRLFITALSMSLHIKYFIKYIFLLLKNGILRFFSRAKNVDNYDE